MGPFGTQEGVELLGGLELLLGLVGLGLLFGLIDKWVLIQSTFDLNDKFDMEHVEILIIIVGLIYQAVGLQCIREVTIC